MGKKFLRGINLSLLLLIIIFTFSSCAKEMNVIEVNNNKQINFSVSVPEWKNTDSLTTTKTSRATPITDNSFGTDKSFDLIADQNDGAGNYTILIDKESVSYTNNIWKTSNDYYWSGTTNKAVNFYAYCPTSISSNISHIAGSAPTLLYTVPSDASNQIDIITAINPNISGSTVTSISLAFNHIFAAVKFAVGASGLPSGTIKSITISGIKNSGTYTFGSGWALGSTASSFTVSPSTTTTGASGENITSDAFTLMMIPQPFTNAIITLTYNTGTTYKQTISGNWAANNIYTYNLSKPVNIGDYYYSDGTWGTIAEHVNSTAKPIAVVFSNSTTTTDNGHGWTHGYGMSLTNAATSVTWGPLGVTALQNISTWSEIVNERDGYSNTQLIKNNYGLSSYPAFYHACNYVVTAPSNSSNWFLPSIGQWYNIAVNLGKIPTTYTSWRIAEPGWGGYANYCASNINSYLSVLNVPIDKFSNNAEYYWCSSEYTSNLVYRSFFSNDTFWLDGNDDDNFKNLNFSVRPVIAF